MEYAVYILMGIVQAWFLAHLWTAHASGWWTRTFLYAIGLNTTNCFGIYLVATKDWRSFVVYAIGQAFGLAYGTWTIHRAHDLPTKIPSIEED